MQFQALKEEKSSVCLFPLLLRVSFLSLKLQLSWMNTQVTVGNKNGIMQNSGFSFRNLCVKDKMALNYLHENPAAQSCLLYPRMWYCVCFKENNIPLCTASTSMLCHSLRI